MKASLNKIKIPVYAYFIFAFVLLLILTAFISRGPSKNIMAAGKEVVSLSSGIQQYFKIRPDYWGLDNAFVIENKIVEKGMVKSQDIISVMGAKILIGQGFNGEVSMPGSRSFDIVYKELGKKDCAALSSLKLKEESSLSLIAIEIKSEKKESVFTWGGNPSLPVESKEASEVCGAENDVLFRFE